MDRSKRVVFISHCVLNQNTVVCPLARAKGAYREIIVKLMDYGIGIHQMPCPEFRHLGLKRDPMEKIEYDTLEYRKLCKDLAKDSINVMKEYLDNDYEIVGIIGINQSPTCSIGDLKGIFMEELFELMDKDIIPSTIDIPTDYIDGKDNGEFIAKLEEFIIKNMCSRG